MSSMYLTRLRLLLSLLFRACSVFPFCSLLCLLFIAAKSKLISEGSKRLGPDDWAFIYEFPETCLWIVGGGKLICVEWNHFFKQWNCLGVLLIQLSATIFSLSLDMKRLLFKQKPDGESLRCAWNHCDWSAVRAWAREEYWTEKERQLDDDSGFDGGDDDDGLG